jgi:hypothetical protein
MTLVLLRHPLAGTILHKKILRLSMTKPGLILSYFAVNKLAGFRCDTTSNIFLENLVPMDCCH